MAVTTPGGLSYTPSRSARLLAMLWFMGAAGASTATLVEICWGDDSSGGPLDSAAAIHDMVALLRADGWPIAQRGGRAGVYVLERPCPPLPPIAMVRDATRRRDRAASIRPEARCP